MHEVFLHAQKAAPRQPRPSKQIAAQAQLLQHTDGGAGVRSPLPFRLFQPIQLLQDHQRQNHGVLLEAVQRVGRLNQHIGIQYIRLLHSTSPDVFLYDTIREDAASIMLL